MDRCGCGDDFAAIFDRETAERDRKRYRRKGPDRTTRMLLEMIGHHGVEGASVLDIGGGIGVIDRELLRAGARRAVLVEASTAYLDVAREEARRSSLLDRFEFVEGDFVRRAGEVPAADIVTLDRVVCCYRDAERLVSLSADRATRLYGLVLPRDGWPVRLALALGNVVFRLRRTAYRAYGHPHGAIDALVAERALRPVADERTLFWRVVLFARPPVAATPTRA